MVSIRPFHAIDTQSIISLLQSLWGHDATMLALYRVHRDWSAQSELLRVTLVATVNNSLVGVGTLFESTLHPSMLMATINVAAQWQRRGIGTSLFQALKQHTDHRPWFIKLTQRDTAGVAFCAKHGFHPVVRTMTGMLDPHDEAVRAWIATLPTTVSNGRILRVDPADSAEQLKDIALVHAAIYHQFHSWNPPIEETAEMALAHYCGSTVIPGSHLCAYMHNRPVGAANLVNNPFHSLVNEAYLVNIGVIGSHQSYAYDLTAALIRRSLEFAAEQNMRVRFEADNTYVPHYTLFQQAPIIDINQDFVIVANT